jgi:hypothetical protein
MRNALLGKYESRFWNDELILLVTYLQQPLGGEQSTHQLYASNLWSHTKHVNIQNQWKNTSCKRFPNDRDGDILDERSDEIPNLLGAVLAEVGHSFANRSNLSKESK